MPARLSGTPQRPLNTTGWRGGCGRSSTCTASPAPTITAPEITSPPRGGVIRRHRSTCNGAAFSYRSADRSSFTWVDREHRTSDTEARIAEVAWRMWDLAPSKATPTARSGRRGRAHRVTWVPLNSTGLGNRSAVTVLVFSTALAGTRRIAASDHTVRRQYDEARTILCKKAIQRLRRTWRGYQTSE